MDKHFESPLFAQIDSLIEDLQPSLDEIVECLHDFHIYMEEVIIPMIKHITSMFKEFNQNLSCCEFNEVIITESSVENNTRTRSPPRNRFKEKVQTRLFYCQLKYGRYFYQCLSFILLNELYSIGRTIFYTVFSF